MKPAAVVAPFGVARLHGCVMWIEPTSESVACAGIVPKASDTIAGKRYGELDTFPRLQGCDDEVAMWVITAGICDQRNWGPALGCTAAMAYLDVNDRRQISAAELYNG